MIMAEFDLDKLISAMGSEEVGKNATSIFGMLQETTKILGELDKILGFLKKLESSIMVSAVVKMQAKKAGIELTPLAKEEPGIVPKTKNHETVMQNINALSEAQLLEVLRAMERYDSEHQKNRLPESEKGRLS